MLKDSALVVGAKRTRAGIRVRPCDQVGCNDVGAPLKDGDRVRVRYCTGREAPISSSTSNQRMA